MTAQVTILPTGKKFLVEGAESILEAGLRSGLALDYGCSNGNCGLCKVRLESGEVQKISHHDYVFTESEKGMGYILSCSNTAVDNVVVEAREAGGVDDIPEQLVQIRIKKIERPDPGVIVLSTKTPRTNRLRFLAGQSATLAIAGIGSNRYSIASCPCDDMNLEFHILNNADDPVARHLHCGARVNETISLRGPQGSFCLNENSPNSLVFIAQGSGFAPIRGLIEHAMALDRAERMHLYWIADKDAGHYLNNLCRSWNDAFDNFTYLPIAAGDNSIAGDEIISAIVEHHENPAALDFYLCAREELTARIELWSVENAIPQNNLRTEKLIFSASDNQESPGMPGN